MGLCISRRTAGKQILFGLFSASAMAFGQDFTHARDLVGKVQNDLERAAEFTRSKEKESDRYRNVQKRLSDFDRDLSRGKFDKGKLDEAIEDLKSVTKNNTLEAHDRDSLMADLEALRELRATF